jgi:hypothetical protein
MTLRGVRASNVGAILSFRRFMIISSRQNAATPIYPLFVDFQLPITLTGVSLLSCWPFRSIYVDLFQLTLEAIFNIELLNKFYTKAQLIQSLKTSEFNHEIRSAISALQVFALPDCFHGFSNANERGNPPDTIHVFKPLNCK